MKEKVIYYSNELEDDFVDNSLEAKIIDEKYFYGDNSWWWNFKCFVLYKVLIRPAARFYLKFFEQHKIINKEVLKPYKDSTYFMYANHTNPGLDPFIPTAVSNPNPIYVIISPVNLSIPVLGPILKYLGGLPLPSNMKATKNFLETIKLRVSQNHPVMIYPEAHLWPYYTKIRPFTELSFRYPVQYKTPVFCFTNTYHKRKIGKKPRIVTYVDGPFFPDENLSTSEQKTDLRNKVYEAMVNRSKNSNYELIKYIKK